MKATEIQKIHLYHNSNKYFVFTCKCGDRDTGSFLVCDCPEENHGGGRKERVLLLDRNKRCLRARVGVTGLEQVDEEWQETAQPTSPYQML